MTDTENPKAPAKISHDALFRVLLEDPDRAATLLREYLPPALNARMADGPPKLIDGTFVDDKSRVTQSDRLFKVTLKDGPPVLVYTLLEYKSTPDHGTPLQLLGYMVRIWTRFAEGKPARLRALPPIVPMLFYHGRSTWTVPQDFGEMVERDADTAPFVPTFRYDLHDLGVGPQEALSGDAPIRAVLSALRYVQRGDAVTREVLTAMLRDLPDGTVLERIVFSYIVEKYEVPLDKLTAALDDAKDGGSALMDTIAETLRKQGKAEGKAEGLAAGEALGREKGKVEGLAEGEAKSLMRLLVKRFGPLPDPVVAQIAAGSIEDLDRWFDAAITASSVEAVFGKRRDH